MLRKNLVNAVITIILILLTGTSIDAQERRIAPSFPIGAGEAMIIISGFNFFSATNITPSVFSYPSSAVSPYYYQLILPVGTRLRRLVVDAYDTDSTPGASLTISLIRVSNTSSFSSITLRSVSTSSISSTSFGDFKQLVSNPLDHAILQGWTYFVKVAPEDHTKIDADECGFSAVKVIVEP